MWKKAPEGMVGFRHDRASRRSTGWEKRYSQSPVTIIQPMNDTEQDVHNARRPTLRTSHL